MGVLVDALQVALAAFSGERLKSMLSIGTSAIQVGIVGIGIAACLNGVTYVTALAIEHWMIGMVYKKGIDNVLYMTPARASATPSARRATSPRRAACR